MEKKRVKAIFSLIVVGLFVVACGTSAQPEVAEPDRVATRVAEDLAVAATLTAAVSASQVSATPPIESTLAPEPTDPVGEEPGGDVPSPTPTHTATPPAPTSTGTAVESTPVPSPTPLPPEPTETLPQPSPTPILIAVLPVDGGGGDVPNIRNNSGVMGGRSITLPGFSPAEVYEPMVFRDRMVFQAEVFDANVGTKDGDGIEDVQFIIRDDRGQQVHTRQEEQAGFCVFGGGEPDCNVLFFADSGYRWPDGGRIYPVQHQVDIVINPLYGDDVTWVWTFDVELAQPAARINGIGVEGDRYVVEFETFGFEPQLPGQHVHFFFDTVSPEEAGVPGQGPWILYGEGSPFTEYSLADRPEGAAQMCVLVANPDHSVQANSGNCFDLP
jgi:hypothetical protein